MNEVKKILRRLSLFYWLIFVLGILIVGKIVSLQVFPPEIKARDVRVKEVDAIRGSILSHDGRVLAISQVAYDLRMDFRTPALHRLFDDNDIKKLSEALAGFFKDKSADSYKKELDNALKAKSSYKKIGPRDVSYLELQQIKKFPVFSSVQEASGLIPQEYSFRKYPYESARRTVGNKDSLVKKVSTGIEGYFNEYLRGKAGERMEQVSSQGWIPIDSEDDKIAVNGYDIVTTIDINIQDAVETALKNQMLTNSVFEAGTAIVMEVETGEVRAIANLTRNSNNTFSERFNYAISQRSDPGSTFKLATLIALLDDGYVDLNTSVDTENGRYRYQGKDYIDVDHSNGVISVLKAFTKSSNVAFTKLTLKHYKNKEKELVKHFQDMGLDARFNLQIDEEEGLPHIPHPDKSSWSSLSLPQMALGYEVLLAPIHTLTLYNAVANNGKMVKPKFVTEVRKRGQTVETFPTEVICNSICSTSTLKKVKTALEGVVTDGTAKHIKSDVYQIAGKTGTAQILFEQTYRNSKGELKTRMVYKENTNGQTIKKHQASFAGYFPADNPKYTAIVVLYTQKTNDNFHGGRWAAPVFREFCDKIYSLHPEWHDKVKPSTSFADLPTVKGGKSEEVSIALSKLNIPLASTSTDNAEWVTAKITNKKIETVKSKIGENIPSVVNMGLKDALYILENMGLNVYYTGKGIVKSQSIQPGSKVVKGQNITLTLEV